MPIIDLELYLQATRGDAVPSEEAIDERRKVAECFHRFGIILNRDPRIEMRDNDEYIDLMERYFADVGDRFYNNEQVSCIKPEHHYQVGATPEYIEMARSHREKLLALDLEDQDMPVSPLEPVLDAKWRFMWKIGERPEGASDDFPAVIPDGYPDWESKMNQWGGKLHQAVFTVAEMAALGMGVEKNTFT